MPTKRRRRGPVRIGGRLTSKQRCILICGRDYFNDRDAVGIEDDEHGRVLWWRYRDELMVDNSFNIASTPGRRPWGFWRYEFGHWSDHGATEEAAVHEHLADADERARIEARWHQSLRCAIASSLPAPNSAPREVAIGLHGVPGWFYDQRAPLVIKQFQADTSGEW